MGPPEVKNWGNRQEFYWKDDHIYALVERIREHPDSRITSEVSFKTDLEDIPSHILHTQVNLLSTRGKKELINELSERFSTVDWLSAVEQLSTLSLDLYRQGQPVEEIWPEAEIPEPEFLVEPILYKDKPTLLFGEGSSGKSYLALTLALFTQLPYTDNPLNLKPQRANPLFLDYESDSYEMKRRLSTLIKGFELPETPILYRQCTLPLADDIDNIEKIVDENKIGFMIIDSLGIASANGNLNDAATATSFYAALRRLRTTTLILTHVAKDEAKRPSPFGSVYFTNLSRSVFLVQREQQEGGKILNLALFHKKNNQGPLLPPRGFRITFEDDRTIIRKEDVTNVPEFLEKLSLRARIIALLKEGRAPTKEIAENLERDEATIRAVLNRHKDIFVKVEDGWGLKYEKHNEGDEGA